MHAIDNYDKCKIKRLCLTAIYLLGKLGTAILQIFWLVFGKQYLSLRSLNDIIFFGMVLNH